MAVVCIATAKLQTHDPTKCDWKSSSPTADAAALESGTLDRECRNTRMNGIWNKTTKLTIGERYYGYTDDAATDSRRRRCGRSREFNFDGNNFN